MTPGERQLMEALRHLDALERRALEWSLRWDIPHLLAAGHHEDFDEGWSDLADWWALPWPPGRAAYWRN